MDYLDVVRGVGQLGTKIIASSRNINTFCGKNVSALNVLANEVSIRVKMTGQLALKDYQAFSRTPTIS